MPNMTNFGLSDEEPNSLSFDLSGSERLSVDCDDTGVRVFVNSKACSVLAQIFEKLAAKSYAPGFHIHLRRDFDDDGGAPDALTLILTRDE